MNRTAPVLMLFCAMLQCGCIGQMAENEEAVGERQDTLARQVNLNVNLDVLGIANAIAGAVNANRDREGFVKGLMESTFYAAGQRYNVMVFNLSQPYEDHLEGVKFFASTQWHGITFAIWAFEAGTFTNQGDGGWINWAFRGWFDRQGGYVVFRRP